MCYRVNNARYTISLVSSVFHIGADSIQNLPKLVEDIVQTSINTGPRGALRLAQGIQAVIGVGSEWVADASKVMLSAYLSSTKTIFLV